MLVLSHSLPKIFLYILPPSKTGCLLDDEDREDPALPMRSQPPSYRLFDSEFSLTFPTQCLLSRWPLATPRMAGRRAGHGRKGAAVEQESARQASSKRLSIILYWNCTCTKFCTEKWCHNDVIILSLTLFFTKTNFIPTNSNFPPAPNFTTPHKKPIIQKNSPHSQNYHSPNFATLPKI